MSTQEPQPYAPSAGSRAHRVVAWLSAQPPGTQVSSRALAQAAQLDSSDLEGALRSALRHGLIRRHEVAGEPRRLLWSLGAGHLDGQDDDHNLSVRLLTRAMRGGIVINADEDAPEHPDGPPPPAADWRGQAPAHVLALVDHAPVLLGTLLRARQLIEQDHEALHRGDAESGVADERYLVLQQLDRAARIVCQAP